MIQCPFPPDISHEETTLGGTNFANFAKLNRPKTRIALQTFKGKLIREN